MLAPGAQSAYDARQAKLGTRNWDLRPAAPPPRYRDLRPLAKDRVPPRARGATTLRLLRLARGAA